MIFGQFTASSNVANPVEKYIEWAGGDDQGYMYQYDKELGEKVQYELKDFIVLKVASCIRGFSKKYNKMVYSNEVESTVREELTVRCGDVVLAKGLYNDIKEDISDYNFNKAFTILNGNGDVCKVYVKGGTMKAFNETITFSNINSNKFSVTGFTDNKKGRVSYRVPTLAVAGTITDKEREAAIDVVAAIMANQQKPSASETVKMNDDLLTTDDLAF